MIIALLTIITYNGFMYNMVGCFSLLKDYFIRGEYKAGRILEITNNVNTEKFGKYNKKIDNYSIKVNDLSYFYEDSKDYKVLNDINFIVNSKTANVFIGSSGSGKSTLFGLLSKLLQCEDNKIFIGNIDINELSEQSFRNSICIVNQEPFLLNDTILNNLKIVNENASLDEIYNACKKANIYNEIKGFDKDFDTIVTENGNNLSGGQKQRISIARAILKDSPILLFDEPTSALDKRNQELFIETIKTLKKEKTILIIAHKLNDYKIFDKVYELKNGVLFEITE